MDLLVQGAGELDLGLTPATVAQFRIYLTELQRWNARVNLTGLKTERDIVVRHFLDSLAILPFLGEVSSLADVGSGAGFPGLVLKLARPELALTLVEARGKKASFLEYLAARLKLPAVEVASVRLTPEASRSWGPRFGAVVSRAAFPLARFLELAAPLLLPRGLAVALKGPRLTPAELQEGREIMPALGLADLEVVPYRLPVAGETRLAVMARRGA